MSQERNEVEREKILRLILSSKARERLSNVKIVKPELAKKIEDYLIYLYTSGKLNREVTEAEIVQILKSLSSNKTKIKFVRK